MASVIGKSKDRLSFLRSAGVRLTVWTREQIESGSENGGGDAVTRFPHRDIRKAHNIDMASNSAVSFTLRNVDLKLDFKCLGPAQSSTLQSQYYKIKNSVLLYFSCFYFSKFESGEKFAYGPAVLQIVFNEISAAEISQLDTLEQLELLDEFKVTRDDLEHLEDERFGKIERDGKTLYRFRTQEWRFYFEAVDEQVVVHRVLHRGTFNDFLFRLKLPVGEDEALADSKHFWKLIDEGRNARRS